MLSDVTPAASSADPAAKSDQKISASIRKSVGDSRSGKEIIVTIRPAACENFEKMFIRAANSLEGATVLNILAFGAISAAAAATEAMQRVFGKLNWPVTWIEGGDCRGDGIAGIQISALTGGSVQRLELDGSVIGSVFEEGGVRHCVLGGLGPRKGSQSRGDQTKQTLEQMEAALRQAGFSLADLVRTWFYLEDILAWYDEFNMARTDIYSGVKFRTGSLPASTGIGARNPLGVALAAAARATQCLSPRTRVEQIVSPLQCPAPAYGSSFSRAMEITSEGARHLLISGTASIAPGGETLWESDVHKQVDQTMKVVEAILYSRGFSFYDLTRTVAYFKHDADVAAFATWCRRNRLSSLPVVPVQSDICRDNLLFELEADATKSI